MDKFKDFLNKNKTLFFGLYLCGILILAGVATSLYRQSQTQEPESIYDPVKTGAEDEAVMAPDEDYADNFSGTLPPQIPEEIEDIRSALPFNSQRFEAFYSYETETFLVKLKLEVSKSEKDYVRSWFERFPEIEDASTIKITWIDAVEPLESLP